VEKKLPDFSKEIIVRKDGEMFLKFLLNIKKRKLLNDISYQNGKVKAI
jgi:hypothetical protein